MSQGSSGSEAGIERPRPERLRVVVADDDPFARRMIKAALQEAGFIVIAEAANGREAVELTLYYRPDVVLMDVVMPQLDGIAATRRIVKERPEQVVVMLTSADEELGLVGLQAGASGYLSKDLDIAALPRAVEGATRGEAALSGTMGMRLIEQVRRMSTTGMRPIRSPITAREWEVLDLLCERKSTVEIAETLVLASETVRSHIKSILRKLHVSSRDEAVAKAQEMRARGDERSGGAA
jgi:DNA-binding NarL/FixJ family response regulator